MALEKPSGGGHNRRPSLRGTIYNRVQQGQEIVVTWPKKAKKRIHPKTKAQMEFFRQVQWAWKYELAQLIQSYTDAVAGTPLLPRDLYLSAQSGRLLGFLTPEGNWIVSVAVQNDVSETLDYLSSEVGALLVRTPAGWLGLSPGEVGNVLQLQGDPLLPVWGEGGGGGAARTLIEDPTMTGGLRYNQTSNIAASVSLHLAEGCVPSPIEIDRVKIPIRATPSGIYRAVIYDIASTLTLPVNTLGAPLIGIGPEKTLVNGPNVQELLFDAPVALIPGRIYAVGYHKRNAAIQTSFPTLSNFKTGYSSSVATATPPLTLPALVQGNAQNITWWTE